MPRPFVFLVAVTLLASASSPLALAGEPDAKPLRILFVGNSYTYENNLPFVFEALASPVRTMKVTMLAEGGATLRRHLERGTLLGEIAQGQFDVVVLQEQSALGAPRLRDGIALIGDPAPFHQAVREVAKAARAGDARLVLFAAWPRAETPRAVALLHNANVAVARDVGATVAPVGLVWDRLLGGDAGGALRLYGPDGSHPAPEGTFVAAAVLARAIVGKSPPLRPVHDVPLMDGRARLSGSFANVAPPAEAIAAIEQAVQAVYQAAAPGERFAELPAPPPVPEPAMPPELARGRLGPSFLRGEWRGALATFGLAEQAEVTLDLRTNPATVRMTHSARGWPGDDTASARWVGPDADGVLTLSYPSKGKECAVELRLCRVGEQLRGVVSFTSETAPDWVRSTVRLTRK